MKLQYLGLLCGAATALALLSGCPTLSGPRIGGDPNPPAYKPKDPSKVRVKVSLQQQNVCVMEGDRPLLGAATCVGIPAKHFTVYSRIEKERPGSYGFWVNGSSVVSGTSGRSPASEYHCVAYPIPYWTEFSPAYGFHQGYVWPFPKTHGCLRLHPNVAPKFFELVKIGTPVNIAYTQPEDQTIGRNVPRPNDYRDPDPPAAHMVSSAMFSRPSDSLLIEQ